MAGVGVTKRAPNRADAEPPDDLERVWSWWAIEIVVQVSATAVIALGAILKRSHSRHRHSPAP